MTVLVNFYSCLAAAAANAAGPLRPLLRARGHRPRPAGLAASQQCIAECIGGGAVWGFLFLAAELVGSGVGSVGPADGAVWGLWGFGAHRRTVWLSCVWGALASQQLQLQWQP